MKEKLINIFKEELHSKIHKNYIYTVYYQLFSLKADDELNSELEYLYTLYKGTDDYFKEESINQWFSIWHKTIRQSDFFDNCFKKVKLEIISEEERKEYKSLKHAVRSEGFSKTNGKEIGKLFNNTYLRYLDLNTKIKCESSTESINGILDSILWNTIQLDTENLLYKIFITTFTYYELD